MAGPVFAFLSQITIDSTNKWIEVDIGAGDVPVSIAEQDYDDIRAVASALQTALIAVHATFTVTVGSTGTVTIARTGNFTISWKTGAHGSDNADDHIGDVLGFSDAADDNGGAASFPSDNQHMYGFYGEAPIGITDDSKDRLRRIGPATFVPVSGRATRTTLATHTRRRLPIGFIPPTKFFSAESATNEDFETWWIDATNCVPFKYYSDTSVWTDEGKWCLESDENEDLLDQVSKLAVGCEHYSLTLDLIKQT